MAAVVTYNGGLRRIEFTIAASEPRKFLRLGRVSAKTAAAWKAKIETIIADKALRRPHDPEITTWLTSLDETMLARLRDLGLASGIGLTDTTLGGWIDIYIASRGDAKASTITTYERAKAKLVTYFKAATLLREITPGHADEFARWLQMTSGGKLSQATARKTVSIAKQIFRAAVRKRLLEASPFADLSGTVPANRKRDYFVSRDEAAKVLAACPDEQWRVMFALSRFAGLRCPSETLGLRLADIDWGSERMLVRSPKTERHQGGDCRVVPIFPELRPYLLQAVTAAPDGAEFVVAQYRSPTLNLRRRLTTIIERAGLAPWPKLWQNLRASCETELAARFPAHVVCAWIGHSRIVAERHYLQVTDADYSRALGLGPTEPEAQQKAQQSASGNEHQDASGENGPCEEKRENTAKAACGRSVSVGDEGANWALQDSNL